jgi:hypothetical protein
VQLLYERLADYLACGGRETVEPGARVAAAEVCAPCHADDLMPPDVRHLMAFYSLFRRFLIVRFDLFFFFSLNILPPFLFP